MQNLNTAFELPAWSLGQTVNSFSEKRISNWSGHWNSSSLPYIITSFPNYSPNIKFQGNYVTNSYCSVLALKYKYVIQLTSY